jgi:magnesium chelatase family protein
MTSRDIRRFCPLDERCTDLLKSSINDLGLSARAHDKILRVARTIADLRGSEAVRIPDVQEAVNYRMLDRNLWT